MARRSDRSDAAFIARGVRRDLMMAAKYARAGDCGRANYFVQAVDAPGGSISWLHAHGASRSATMLERKADAIRRSCGLRPRGG